MSIIEAIIKILSAFAARSRVQYSQVMSHEMGGDVSEYLSSSCGR